MFRLHRLVLVAPVLACALLASDVAARRAAPPVGRTQAPGEQTCRDGGCHASFPLNDPAGGVTLTLIDVATSTAFTSYEPGTSYTLAFGIQSTAAGRAAWGFSMTALAGGTPLTTPFTLTQPTRTGLQTAAGKQYIGHVTGGVDAPAPGTAWQFRFNAPAAGRGTVNFYACANAANNNRAVSGDYITCDVFDVTEAVVGPVDEDGDGLDATQEGVLGTSDLDLDSDDDGLSDSAEVAGGTDPVVFDSDGDGLSDGVERSVTAPIADPDGIGPLNGTNPAVFVADMDPRTSTNATNANTDGDGDPTDACLDGDEDANGNGFVDPGETDPTIADCPVVVPTTVGLRQAGALATSGGPAAACGPRTQPTAESIFDTPCLAPVASCVEGTWSVTGGPDAQLDVTLGEWIRAGQAAASFEPETLVFYELETCTILLGVTKRGDDLVLQSR